MRKNTAKVYIAIMYLAREFGYTNEDFREQIYKRQLNKDLFALAEINGVILFRNIHELTDIQLETSLERLIKFTEIHATTETMEHIARGFKQLEQIPA